MRRSKATRLILKIATTVLLLGLVLATLDTARLTRALAAIDPRFLALGIALCLVFTALRIAKWMLMARSNGLHASAALQVRSMLFALALGIITPGRVGEVVAILPFPSEVRSRAVFAYLYDRVGELATVLLFCIPACLSLLPGWSALFTAGLGAIGTAAVLAILQFRSLRLRLTAFLPARIAPRIREALEAQVQTSFAYWLLSAVTYLVTYAAVGAFIAGCEPVTASSFQVLPVVTLSNLLTITIGGLGLREGLAALLAPTVGLTPEAAAAAFFLSFIWTRLVPGLAGIAWMSAHDFQLRAAR